jgi:hypothetical protein
METVPVLLADDMTDVQIKAFRLSVNKMAELAGWDNDLLRVELSELGELGFDLELTGFSMDEIAALEFDEENYPESSAKEIDPDDYKMGAQCPRCGFEFNEKT